MSVYPELRSVKDLLRVSHGDEDSVIRAIVHAAVSRFEGEIGCKLTDIAEFGAWENLPGDIRQAILSRVAWDYEHRGLVPFNSADYTAAVYNWKNWSPS